MNDLPVSTSASAKCQTVGQVDGAAESDRSHSVSFAVACK